MKTKKYAKLFFICTFALIMSVISASAVFAEEPAPGSDPAVIPVELGKENQKDFLTNEPNQEVIFSYTAKSSKMVYFNFRSSHASKMVLTDGDGNVIQTRDSGVSLQKNQWAPEGSTFYMHMTPSDTHVLCWVFVTTTKSTSVEPPDKAVASIAMFEETNFYGTLDAAFESWYEGSTLKLLKDQELTRTKTVWSASFSSIPRTLDLNDHSLTQKNGGRIFYIMSPCGLNIIDSASSKTTHYYNLPDESKPATISDSPTDYSFEGGYITGGDSWGDNPGGGGIYIEPGASLTMTGGTIFGNRSIWGGGVYAGSTDSTDRTASFVMSGDAAIIGNICKVRDFSGASAGGMFLGYGAVFQMQGGAIRHNAALHSDSNKSDDGGVVIAHNASFTMSGGEISGNFSSEARGGVSSYDESTIAISGTAKITGNTAGTSAENVYLPAGKKILVGEALSNESSIGITMERPDVFTSGEKMTKDSIGCFVSDNENYQAVLSGSEAKLAVKDSVSSAMTAKGRTVKIRSKAKKLKRSKAISAKKAYRIKNKTGKLTYKKINKSGKSKITVNKTTGKITLKKGLKRGTYRVKVRVTDSGDENHPSCRQTATVTIRVTK